MTEHIALAANTIHGLVCERCAGTYTPALPATVERHISALRGFVLMHKHCPEAKDRRQLDLFEDFEPQEHNKPALTDQDDAFGRMYPCAKDHISLRSQLEVVLQGPAPSTEALMELTMSSYAPLFDELAHWARMQLAEMNKREHPEFDCYLPKPPQPMPRALAKLMKPAKKRARVRKGEAHGSANDT